MTSAFDPGDFHERSVGVVQRVGLPFAWRHRLRAAERRAEAVRLEVLETARLEMTYDVALAYIDLLLERRLLEYSRQDHDLAVRLADKARRRFELGDAARLEVLRADVEASRAGTATAERSDALLTAQARLNALLQRPLNAEVTPAEQLRHREPVLEEPRLQTLARQHHPELLAAEHRVEVARLEAQAARVDLVPTVELGLFRQTLRHATVAPSAWRVNLGLEVPLWAAVRQRADLARADAETRRLQHQRQAVDDRVALEVRVAWLQLSAASRRVRLLEGGLLKEAEEVHDTALRSYEEGKVSYMESQDARRTLTMVRVEYARALRDHEVALHGLRRAVGGSLNNR